ncbi:cytochrome oxidase complex assembly protein 1-domain-containing protein [Bombardia bombarda]|uniref:Cytochrome oxidase complex assembly protein 1-domain-containing protein n=1 Tax=Bombardia bombarda TaxID=252184 RepID=A0AA39XJ07_9PEZI|nr:cytochrome oxidase complex assembly protein 1-domain-containing protein [Bombardia bombarda]
MLSRIAHRRAGALEAALFRSIAATAQPRSATTITRHNPITATAVPRRGLVSAPRPGDGPLMERRPDRELPNIEETSFRWSRTLPLFFAVVAFSSVAIFNYQKLSSPVVTSTLYSLRTSQRARDYLGDEIYFKAQIPWIAGEMNQLHGRINIRFAVKGTRNTAVMRFASHRPTARGLFETTEWSLETEDGRIIDLLDGEDPFRGIVGGGHEGLEFADDEDEITRGFRKMGK